MGSLGRLWVVWVVAYAGFDKNSIKNKQVIRQEFHSNTTSQPLPKSNDDGLVWLVWVVCVAVASVQDQIAPCRKLHGAMWSCRRATSAGPRSPMQYRGDVVMQRVPLCMTTYPPAGSCREVCGLFILEPDLIPSRIQILHPWGSRKESSQLFVCVIEFCHCLGCLSRRFK